MTGKDKDFLNPRNSACLGHLFLFHNKYNLGDETEYTARDFANFEDMETFLRETEEAIVVLPVFGYDHGQLRIQVGPYSDPWDSGQLGFIWATKGDIMAWYQASEWDDRLANEASAVLISEVEAYDAYINREDET